VVPLAFIVLRSPLLAALTREQAPLQLLHGICPFFSTQPYIGFVHRTRDQGFIKVSGVRSRYMGRKNALRDGTLPALLIIALLLAGCIGGQSVDDAQDIKNKAMNNNDPGLCAAITDATLRDACYIATVPTFGDVSVCERCVVHLSRDKCMVATAKEKGDITLCARIRTDTDAQPLRRTCYRDLASAIDDADGCRWIEDAGARNACIARFPELRTEGLCAALDAGGLRDDCFSSLAELSGNSTYCEQIATVGSKGTCIASVARTLSDVTLCLNISMEGERDGCYRAIAIELNDPSLCDSIVNDGIKDTCLSPIAVATADLSLCSLVTDPAISDDCYLGIGARGWDTTVCANIQDATSKDLCLSSIVPFSPSMEICETMADQSIKEACIYHVAVASWDTSVCMEHLGEAERGPCIQAVAAAVGNPMLCDILQAGPVHDVCVSQALPDIAPLNLCGPMTDHYPLTLREQCVVAGVRTGANVTACPSDIIAANVSEICTIDLAGRLIDTEVCAKATSPDEWALCVRKVAQNAAEPAVCDSLPEGAQRTWCQAVASGTCERCLSEDLPLSWMRSWCITECALSTSRSVGPNDCESVELPMVRARCLHELAIGNQDDSLCKDISPQALRDNCYARVAAASESVFPCKEISNVLLRGTCTARFAIRTRNAELCHDIESSLPRLRCLSLVARTIEDQTICDHITSVVELDWCMAISTPDCTEPCSINSVDWARDLCLYHCALIRQDASPCADIDTNSTKYACLLELAENVGDDGLCDGLAGEARAWCRATVVGDLAACDIVDDTIRDRWC